jgi:hypothetical protein
MLQHVKSLMFNAQARKLKSQAVSEEIRAVSTNADELLVRLE